MIHPLHLELEVPGELCDPLTLGNLYVICLPTGRENGVMGDNFPTRCLRLDGLCCRRYGRTGLSSMWWPKGNTTNTILSPDGWIKGLLRDGTVDLEQELFLT
jgi:hypothetical protein